MPSPTFIHNQVFFLYFKTKTIASSTPLRRALIDIIPRCNMFPTAIIPVGLSRLPPRREDHDGNVHHTDDTGHDRIGNNAAVHGIAGEREAEPTVDDTADDQDAAVPDVAVADGCALANLLVLSVVEETEEGLDEEEGHNDNSKYRVGVVEELASVSCVIMAGIL
jgi:hypothetical protein